MLHDVANDVPTSWFIRLKTVPILLLLMCMCLNQKLIYYVLYSLYIGVRHLF